MFRLYRYRDLVWNLVVRDLKVRYRRSAIGLLWSMLQPLLTMLVLNLVFSNLFLMKDFGNIKNFPLYALAGILFWNFFQQSIVCSMNSLKANGAILQKLPVPLDLFPVTTMISGVINLLLALVPLLGIMLWTGHPFTPALLFLPVSILIAALFTLGAGYLLSPLAVFFSDVVELVTVVLTLLFYLTPIIYPKAMLEGHPYFWVIRYNPVRSILEVFRDPIYFNKVPPLSHLGVSLALAVGVFLLGSWVFRRSARKIPFYL